MGRITGSADAQRQFNGKDTLREDEKSLSKLATSIGIEPAKLHKKHRIVLKRKMLSSMGYTLQMLKNEGKVSEYWDPLTRKKRLQWPEDLVSEILGETATLSTVLERILKDSTPADETAPSRSSSGEATAAKPKATTNLSGGTTDPMVIIIRDDDDDDDDFLDWERDIEMGKICTSLAKTVLSDEVWML
ncbi:hypothetical protein N0V84_009557 [Fusarium piperis]|uniref:Uncharacterized protein n=1 Tax=Fusarium piperis TaxID=1435070 RepID=A0A9W8W638_9HYPO|nr:hypothetical protein N0V84_009557 [Fusarium piperis]